MKQTNKLHIMPLTDSRAGALVLEQLQAHAAAALLVHAKYCAYWDTFASALRDLHLPFDRYACKVLTTADMFIDRIHTISNDVSSTDDIRLSARLWRGCRHVSPSAVLDEAEADIHTVIAGLVEAVQVAAEEQDRKIEELLLWAAVLHGEHGH